MHSILDISIAASLAVIAVILFLYLAKLMLFPLSGLFKRYTETIRSRRAEDGLKEIDKLISSGNIAEAIKQLRTSIILNYAPSMAVLNSTAEHHANVLSRCLAISEATESRPLQIAEVERLLMQRSELHMLLFRAEESFRSIRSRRNRAGKSLPEWSTTDYKSRILEIHKELKKNRSELEVNLEKLFSSLGQPGGDSVVYH